MIIRFTLKLSRSGGISLLRWSLTMSLKGQRICHPKPHQRWSVARVLWVNFRLHSRRPCVVIARFFLLLASRVSVKPRSWIHFIGTPLDRTVSEQLVDSAWKALAARSLTIQCLTHSDNSLAFQMPILLCRLWQSERLPGLFNFHRW